jgi:hypothetical protein
MDSDCKAIANNTDKIQNGRLKAISGVEKQLASEIIQRKESYASALSLAKDTRQQRFDREWSKLMDCLVLGYLHLEGSRWGVITGEIGHQYNSVSFEDICKSIREMIDFDPGYIRPISVVDIIPSSVSIWSVLVPSLWDDHRDAHTASVLTSALWSSKKKFNELVEALEQDEWGLDLELCLD